MKTQVKEVLHSNRPLKEKISYFMGYYLKTILAIVVALGIVISIVWEMLHPAAPPELAIAVAGTDEDIVNLKNLAAENDKLKSLLTEDATHQVYYLSSTDQAARQKYMALLASGELDLLILPQKEYDLIERDKGGIDWQEKAPELKSQDEEKGNEGLLLKTWLNTGTNEGEDFYLVVPVNSKNVDKTITKLTN